MRKGGCRKGDCGPARWPLPSDWHELADRNETGMPQTFPPPSVALWNGSFTSR
jgi:hypothetical protein